MMYKIYFIFLFVFLSACIHPSMRQPSSEIIVLPITELNEMVPYRQLGVRLRAGYSLETSELKGCVLYLQGLADSIRSHKCYFSCLNEAGYRVIFFDYMGQGGSEGSMNNTRVQVELPPTATKQMLQKYERQEKHYEIPEQGDFFWARYKQLRMTLARIALSRQSS